MKKALVWMFLSVLLVLILVISSCGQQTSSNQGTTVVTGTVTQVTPSITTATTATSPTTSNTTTSSHENLVTLNLTKLDGTKVSKTVEKPQYGNTIYACCIQTTENFDPGGKGLFLDPVAQYNVYQGLVTFDWTRGPAGTGEVQDVGINSSDEYWIPLLAESYEMPDNKTLIFHLRKGIRFQNKPPANGRELTADDVVESILRCARVRGGSRIKVARGDKVYSSDNNTVVVELATPPVSPIRSVLFDMWIYDPDTVDTNDKVAWQNVVSVGPYILKDYVASSSITMEKNPNYWQNDPLFPDNKLPYADKIVSLLISDPATRLSAIRTGKIDRIVGLSYNEASTLNKSSSLIEQKEGPGTLGFEVYYRADKKPLDDLRVRQALTMAIDRQSILQSFLEGHGLLDWQPIRSDTPAYTPLEELPDDVRELWEYNPDKAKQLLNDAGYGNGFSLDVMYSDRAGLKDYFLLVEKYWADIGVTAKGRLVPWASYKGEAYARTYDILFWETSGGGAYIPFYYGHTTWGSGASFSYFWGVDDKGNATFSDKQWDEMLLKASNATYPNPGYEIQKECNIFWQRKVYFVPMPLASNFTAWWPWLKGYYGEVGNGQTFSFEAMYAHCWIDQNLKTQITGK